ncbi:DoxX family protein [Aldersonia sp. NBC_00410]|nr:DoxX family protein [Aldersonia sp. NBC_00410]
MRTRPGPNRRPTRTIGVLEVRGALGLILPPLTAIAVGLAIAVAVALVVLQVCALALHLRRGEVGLIGLNVISIVLGGVAVWLSTTWRQRTKRQK